ncbi:substrate-binding periplasmic protein [Aliagarivorans taiwanensis]|uniref:substrate-binding periplasmic protein n=1 Tax=Aliagarivorans taiwanensis TaxID=561966 RepID=UPI00047C9FBE|nr:transporter substrate-binding domain-containing protein [Aliagarivorans taiwanensis]
MIPTKLWLLSVTLLLTTHTASSKPLVIACPENLPIITVGSKIIEHAYAKLGITLSYRALPAKRSIQYANEGKADGELLRVASFAPDYPNLIKIPVAISYLEQSLFSATHKHGPSTCRGLSAYRVGVIRGVKHAETCAQHAKEVIRYNDMNQMMRVLNTGRIDFVISGKVTASLRLNGLGLSNINALEPPLSRAPLYHYLNKKHQALASQLHGIFLAMHNSGELEKIREDTVTALLASPSPDMTCLSDR